ncbi:MAG TPA: adenosine deaminase [Gaiellaceae bacterium]|nr:adenosine deaminase [Gaiellaceae bacterium]
MPEIEASPGDFRRARHARARPDQVSPSAGAHGTRAYPEQESGAKRSGARDKDYPKIELHVHLEGTVRAHTLLEIARRNDYPLPATTVEGLQELYRFTDFRHFIEVWILTTNALKKEEDYRQMVVDYAAEAAGHGAVYLEGIFSPAERVRHGCTWEDVFEGVCNGAQEAKDLHGVEIRLTPDIPRGFTLEEARETVDWCARYRERGVVGVGLGGLEAEFPPEPYEEVFAYAKSLGLGSVPHAGEVAGAASVRGALENLQADRLRHGIRIEEDDGLVREAVARGTVLDVCPLSNLRTGAVASLDDHPLPRLVAAGVRCSISTDDPAMFDTDLSRDYEVATGFGLDPRSFYEAGVAGALCDAETKERLRRIGESWDWRR